MSMKLFKTAFTALRVNLLRSFLTMLGIIIGVSAVIVMVALGAGAQREVDAQIEAMGGNIFVLMGSWRRMGGAATAAGSIQSLTTDHAELLEQELYSIETVAPEQDTNAQIVYGNLNWATEVVGTDNRYFAARNWQIELGREFTAQEVAGAGKVALIGDTLRRELFGGGDPIGETIRVNRLNATVIGTLAPKGQDMRGRDQDDLILMPLTTVQNRLSGRNFSNPDAVERLFVKAYDGENLDYVEEDIATLMRDSMRVQAESEDPFRLRNLSEMVETRAATQAIFNSLLAGVASVSLLVGGIGIMNIMLVSVTERTREIGLRMAVGASPKNILNQFLVEAITLCGLGGAIGIAIAAAVVAVLPGLFETPAYIQPQVVALSLGFSALIGIFFGYYPALKASRLQPIDALRFE
ncbi:MAG TPA: ABC transporter permease [Gammaproteobacteria bacterium]|nr:ABC transporter permease [Gammaproteobacteria bacterium]